MPYKDKEGAKAYRAAYYRAHKEDLIARQKERDLLRMEDVIAYRKEYYLKNKESLLEKQRVRNKLNYEEKKPEYAKKSKKWAEENPERMKYLAKKNRLENREKYAEYRKKHYMENIDQAAVGARIQKMKRFGITPSQYEDMLAKQCGVCAICGMENEAKGQFYLHIDHCHKTGKVRGLLCNRCNAMLGMAMDNTETLQKAILYLNS